jgi:hypothetical protein
MQFDGPNLKRHDRFRLLSGRFNDIAPVLHRAQGRACMGMMGVSVPRNIAATAQSVYGLASGLVTAAVTLCSGVLYARYGGAAFLPMAGLCAVALPFAWFGLQ